MRSLKKFDPFIKEQEKSFSLEKILGLKSSAKSNSPTIKENGNCTVKAIIDEIKMH